MEVHIRKGNENDIEQIHQLVVELAIYEKEPEAVTATLEDYRQDFAAGIFETLVAVVDEKVVGMMIYYMTYSTWKGKMLYLEDFLVTESFRRKGVGELLFQAFMDTAKEKGAILTKWQVLDWNEPALSFYRKIGATIETEWQNCKLYL